MADISIFNDLLNSSGASTQRGSGQLLKAFWVGVAAVLVLAILSTETTSLSNIGGAFLIGCAALLPSLLWCSRRAVGLPIYPVFALTYLWTYALPLLSNHPAVMEYSAEERLFASFTIVGFLSLATFVWFQFVSTVPKPPHSFYVFKTRAGGFVLLVTLASGALFNMGFAGGWFYIAYDMFGPLRNTIVGLASAGIFVVICFKGMGWISVRRYGALVSGLFTLAVAGAGAYLVVKITSSVLPASPDAIGGVISILRTVTAGLSVLATFVLAYRWGKRELPRNETVWLVVLLLMSMIASAASLLLVGALSAFFLATVAFTLGRRRIPWIAAGSLIICFMFLHLGKAEMRGKYWSGEVDAPLVQPWQYPSWFAEWVGFSLHNISTAGAGQQTEDTASLSERASLMHLLLLSQHETSLNAPLLYGETYAIIPQLLVPRLLMPDKLGSHEGTTLLNIHYGQQTREDSERYTIGWGLLNEAYANFGLLGCAALGIVIGVAYGKIARWSMHAPLLSFRFLFTVMVMSLAFQTEFSAGIYITTLFQSFIALLAVTLFFMEPFKSKRAAATWRDEDHRFNVATTALNRL